MSFHALQQPPIGPGAASVKYDNSASFIPTYPDSIEPSSAKPTQRPANTSVWCSRVQFSEIGCRSKR